MLPCHFLIIKFCFAMRTCMNGLGFDLMVFKSKKPPIYQKLPVQDHLQAAVAILLLLFYQSRLANG